MNAFFPQVKSGLPNPSKAPTPLIHHDLTVFHFGRFNKENT